MQDPPADLEIYVQTVPIDRFKNKPLSELTT